VDRDISFKRRKRRLSSSEMVERLLALWTEQDVILCDELRDGHVSASSGKRRVIERALRVLPQSIDDVHLRADSALYDHALTVFRAKGKVALRSRCRFRGA
jgi:hypothetical protein